MFQTSEARFVVLSSVVLSLAVGVGKEDAVDMVRIEVLETVLEEKLEDELILVMVGIVVEGASSLEGAEPTE